MPSKPGRFTEALLRDVATHLHAHERGISIEQLHEVSGVNAHTLQHVVRIVGRVWTKGRANQRATYIVHEDFEARIREYRAEPVEMLPPVGTVDGVCADCACKPQPSQFEMRAGRPFYTACPKDRAPAGSPTLLRSEIAVPTAEQHRRAVVRALRSAEGAVTERELQAATLLSGATITTTLAQLLQQGVLTRLIRVRPGQPTVPIYCLQRETSDPRRAS